MMDPPDRIIEMLRLGDQSVLSVPSTGEMGFDPDAEYESVPGHEPKIFRVYRATLAANAEDMYECGDRPEYWIVSVRPILNASEPFASMIWVWSGRQASGSPVEVTSGKKARIPSVGNATALYVRAVGTVSSDINIAAVRGYDFADLSG